MRCGKVSFGWVEGRAEETGHEMRDSRFWEEEFLSVMV